MFCYIFLIIYALILGAKLESSERAYNEKFVNELQATDIYLQQTDLTGEKSKDSSKNNTNAKLIINETMDSGTSPVENQAYGKIIYGNSENRVLANETVSVSNSINRELSNGSGVTSTTGEVFDTASSNLIGSNMEGTGSHNISQSTDSLNTSEDSDNTDNTLICELLSVVNEMGIKIAIPVECNNISVSHQDSEVDSIQTATATNGHNFNNNSNSITTNRQTGDAEMESQTENKIYLDNFIRQYMQQLLECTFSNIDVSKLLDLPETAIDILQMNSD